MNDSEFLQIVNSDCRSETSTEERQFLRDPENLVRWLAVLHEVMRNVEDTHAYKNAELNQALADADSGEITTAEFSQVRADVSGWKARVRRFERSVTERLREAKALVREHHLEPSGNLLVHIAVIAQRTVNTWRAWGGDEASESAESEHDNAIAALEAALSAIPRPTREEDLVSV